jgi:hypothetical protein
MKKWTMRQWFWIMMIALQQVRNVDCSSATDKTTTTLTPSNPFEEEANF